MKAERPRAESATTATGAPPRGSLQRMVRLRPWWQWHCRRAGGLFVGLRYHFPCSIVDDDESRWTQVSLSVGLLCATLHLDLHLRQAVSMSKPMPSEAVGVTEMPTTMLVPRRELPLREPKATADATAAGDEQPNDASATKAS
jgi:hypothetical protein